MNHSVKRGVRSRHVRVVAWPGVGLMAVVLMPLTAIAAGQPLDVRVAYLDPGTGSLILQAIVATFAGAVVAVSVYWQKIKTFFRRSSRKSESSDTAPSDD
jgi:hypothetical protein